MNTGKRDRLWNLQTSANALIQQGKMNPAPLVAFLQNFVYGSGISNRQIYEELGMEADYDEAVKTLEVEENGEFWNLLVLKSEKNPLTLNKVVATLRRLGVDMDLYTKYLDTQITHNDRDPNRDRSYIVGFAKNVEADEEFKNLSANQLKEQNHKGITLLERLHLELGYFLATEKHLDKNNWTLCTGSRCSDGNVPCVAWASDVREVYVSWCHPGYSNYNFRSRSAVSLPV